VEEDRLAADYIIPSPLDRSVAAKVAEAVQQAARESGLARM
jgi:malate dehydrogenase (oxaloacetate-decarboxylating)